MTNDRKFLNTSTDSWLDVVVRHVQADWCDADPDGPSGSKSVVSLVAWRAKASEHLWLNALVKKAHGAIAH